MSCPDSGSFLKDKRILITGATGFIGSHLARRILAPGTAGEVHALCRKKSNKWRLGDIEKKIRFHYVDLREYVDLRKVVLNTEPEFIFHCASYGGFPHQDDEKEILTTNINGTINLINSLSDIDYRHFVNTGSSSEYGIKSSRMSEKDSLKPVNMYGISKAFAAIYAGRMAEKQKKPITTIRPFSVYGPYDSKARLISSFILAILKGDKTYRVKSSSAVRDFVYIDDVADFFFEVSAKANSLGVLNIGSGKQRSVSEAITEIKRIAGSDIEIEWGDDKKKGKESGVWEADMSKSEKILKWKTRTDFKTGTEKTIEWMRRNRRIYEKED